MRVDQFQHHRGVTGIGGMRRDELLRDTHQSEQSAIAVIQVGELDHRGGCFGR